MFWPKGSGKISADPKTLNNNRIAILPPNEIELLMPSIKYFIFPFFDFMINSPRLGARQKLYRLIRELTAFSPREIFIFGENLNESEYVSQIITNNWRAFLQSELRERKKLSLPPFTQAVLAVSRAKDKTLAQKHLDKFISQLPKSTPVFLLESNFLFLVNYNFDFSRLSLPASIHLEIDRGDLV
jgi:hypothetical protein